MRQYPMSALHGRPGVFGFFGFSCIAAVMLSCCFPASPVCECSTDLCVTLIEFFPGRGDCWNWFTAGGICFVALLIESAQAGCEAWPDLEGPKLAGRVACLSRT